MNFDFEINFSDGVQVLHSIPAPIGLLDKRRMSFRRLAALLLRVQTFRHQTVLFHVVQARLACSLLFRFVGMIPLQRIRSRLVQD